VPARSSRRKGPQLLSLCVVGRAGQGADSSPAHQGSAFKMAWNIVDRLMASVVPAAWSSCLMVESAEVGLMAGEMGWMAGEMELMVAEMELTAGVALRRVKTILPAASD
jgi:hypothetical protein